MREAILIRNWVKSALCYQRHPASSQQDYGNYQLLAGMEETLPSPPKTPGNREMSGQYGKKLLSNSLILTSQLAERN